MILWTLKKLPSKHCHRKQIPQCRRQTTSAYDKLIHYHLRTPDIFVNKEQKNNLLLQFINDNKVQDWSIQTFIR